jgi:uncharacterized protein (TIGR00369 family)
LKDTKTKTAHLTLKELRQLMLRSNASRDLGFEIVSANRKRTIMQLRILDRHKQIQGMVHGGVVAALADSAGGMASYMAAEKGSRVVTLELKINYLEGAQGRMLIAEAKIIRLGKHTSVVDCELRDDTKLVAKALTTYFVSPPNAEKG